MNKTATFLIICLLPFFTLAQEKKGLEFDDQQYMNTQSQATLIRGVYTPLPDSASIKQFSPKPLSQRMDNTSPGWAVAYGARTILEAKRRNLTNQLEIRKVSFSPVFNYYLAKPEESQDCSVPVKLPDVLESMKKYGVPKYMDFRKACPSGLSDEAFIKAAENRIDDYFRLFSIEDDHDRKIEAVKRSLSKEVPVIIGMHIPKSFELVKDKFWVPREQFHPDEQPGHAMVVVGYDDSKYSGAFEVLNSWGVDWGNKGFMWIRYKDFAEFTRYAFELFVLPGANQDAIDLAGKVEIPLLDGTKMDFYLVDESRAYYKTVNNYGDNTAFKVLVSSMESAFVYIIGSDETEEIFPLFPDEGTSAVLPYKNSRVILPGEDEDDFWVMDDVPGNGFLCVIFSKEELWLKQIESNLIALKGRPFIDKIHMTFKDKMVVAENIDFESESISFEGKTKGKVLTAIIIEIQHN